MAEIDNEREAFLAKIGQVKPAEEKKEIKPNAKKEEE